MAKWTRVVYRKSSTSDKVLHYRSNHPTNHKRLRVKTLFDRAQLYCSDKTTLALERSYLLNMFRNCGYPLSFIRHSMRRRIPRGHGQRESLTPEVPSEDQRTSPDSEPRWATLTYQRYLRDTSPAPTKPQHQSGTQTYGHPQNYPGESQRRNPLEAKAGVIYQFSCKGCNAKYVEETC